MKNSYFSVRVGSQKRIMRRETDVIRKGSVDTQNRGVDEPRESYGGGVSSEGTDGVGFTVVLGMRDGEYDRTREVSY